MPVPALNDHLCFSIYAAQQAIARAYQPLLAELGLTYPQYIVMVALWQEDGITVGAVGRQVGLATNTLTPLLNRLETAGLVQRKRDRRDERRLRLHLTETGQALEAHAADLYTTVLKSAGMSRTEAKAMQGWIDELRGTLAENLSA